MKKTWARVRPIACFGYIALVLAGCVLPRAALAQAPPACPQRPDPSWTRTEAWLFSQICAGQVGDLENLDAAALSLTAPAPWPPDRTISAAFITEMLSDPRYRLTVSSNPIVILNARVTDPVVIGNATLQNKLFIGSSRFDSSLEIDDANSTQGLVLQDDNLAGPLVISRSGFEYLTLNGISGPGMKVTNDVFADNVQLSDVGFAGPVAIIDTKIGGDLALVPARPGTRDHFQNMAILGTTVAGTTAISNAAFDGEFEGGRDSFGGGLSIDDAIFSQTAFFDDTDFGKLVDVEDSAFATDLRFVTSKFESELNVSHVNLCLAGKACELFLVDANFGGKVTIDHLRINGDVNADGAAASGALELTNDSDAQHPLAVTMMDATIARDLTIGKTRLSELQLANTNISGTLQFLDAPGTAWSGTGWLGLSGATIGVLSNASWDWPASMYLEGMRFGLIGLRRADLDAGCINGNWSLWLRGAAYSPEPYRQLAKYLSDSGDAHAATCVLETSQTRALSTMSPLKRILYWTYGQVAGFGYAPERAFWFAAGFVLLGVLVLKLTGQGERNQMPVGLFFSFSELIPLVSLDKKFDDVALTGFARWYFYAHKIIGYVIALFIAAALSGLSNRS